MNLLLGLSISDFNKNSDPGNYKREFTRSVENVPLEIKSEGFISPGM